MTTKRRPRTALPFLLATLLAACGGDGEVADDAGKAPSSGAFEGPVWREASNRGSFEAVVQPSVAEFVVNEPFDVSIELFDAETGDPLEGVDAVAIDARMPAHRHGMLRDVAVDEAEDGARSASGLVFHMVGHWEIQVDVTRGAHTERAQFDVTLEF